MNFKPMPRKEKDLDVSILQTYTDATHLQTDKKTIQTNVAKARVDFLKSPSSNLICHKTSRMDCS